MSAHIILIFVFKVFVFCCCNSFLEATKECITPRQTQGDCIPIHQCPSIIGVFGVTPLDDETKRQIQQYQCQVNRYTSPSVCCERDANPCITNEKTAGICVPINRCSTLQQLLELKPFLSSGVVQYLQSAQCSEPGSSARVCCPFVAKPTRLIREPLEEKLTLPQPGECGIQDVEARIIGGTKTDLTEFPWMAILEYGSKIKPNLACGGTLISSRFVLTAAHCVEGPTVKRYGGVQRIRLGEYNIKNETDCFWFFGSPSCALPILRIDVEKIAFHENFVLNSLDRQHDIAVIKMKQDVTYTEFVRPICLPTAPEIQIPNQLTVAGWGRTEMNDQSDDKLKLNIPLFDKTNCTNLYQKIARGLKLGKGQICAGGITGKDSCTGDSGGPLMAPITVNTDKVWYQYGVISFGPTPCGKPHPAVYTYVSEYRQWMLQQMNKL